ncbi:patatin-like phospholipase family protein [Georgenia sp. AZ-5]|uniref:patatin-like phospholipase family protein n=1 Tax=Georgenia sp. AZ-5 TaxID=3367526 RepID=UPI0037545D75
MFWKLRERQSADERVGLVLSGGGARASFQIGALRYLYDRLGVTPQVITGTSAGSILAAVLAQASDHAGQRRALAGLEGVWLGMRESSDMFTELEWFALLRRRGPALVTAFTRQQRRQSTLGRSFARVADRTVRRGTAEEAAALSAVVVDGPDGQVTADDPPADGTWAPVNVVELVTALREAGRARPDLEAIVRGARRAQSMYRPGSIVDRLLDPEVFTPERVAASGVTLRVAVVALESGELRYVTERGELVDRCDAPVPGTTTVPLVEAIRASCAIPAVFAPVQLGEEHYVDPACGRRCRPRSPSSTWGWAGPSPSSRRPRACRTRTATPRRTCSRSCCAAPPASCPTRACTTR